MPEAEAQPGSTSGCIGQNGLVVNDQAVKMAAFEGLEIAISPERFDSYLISCKGDRGAALALYALNAAVSAALYPTLQTLEIAVRNAFHRQLSERYGDWWFDELGVITDVFQRQKINEAKLDLVKDQKPLTAGRVIAALSFGFWTSCLGARYEDTLWRRGGLSGAFMANGEKPQRNRVNRILTPVRLLRNRIAHHEPILHLNVVGHRARIIDATAWVSPVMAEWSRHHCRFDAVYDAKLAALFIDPRKR